MANAPLFSLTAPTAEEVSARSEQLERKALQIAALAASLSDRASVLEGTGRDVEHVQALSQVLEETAEQLYVEARWIAKGLEVRCIETAPVSASEKRQT